jgi:hypothetical protein
MVSQPGFPRNRPSVAGFPSVQPPEPRLLLVLLLDWVRREIVDRWPTILHRRPPTHFHRLAEVHRKQEAVFPLNHLPALPTRQP